MKKRWKWILPVVLPVVMFCFLRFVAVPGISILVFSINDTWKTAADFEDYASDFTAVKDYVAETYAGSEGKHFFVVRRLTGVGADRKRLVTLYDIDMHEDIELPPEVGESLRTIAAHGFPHKDAHFSMITVYPDRVAFHIESGRYALIYSPKERPRWIFEPNDEHKIRVRRIGNGWYHVVAR